MPPQSILSCRNHRTILARGYIIPRYRADVMPDGFSGVTPKPLSQSDFLVEDWQVQPTLNLIVRGSTISHLEPKAMQVLVLLAEHQGEVLSKDMLLNAVWPDTFIS